jgi:twitching motility protein PilT
MQSGASQSGMQTFNQALATAYYSKLITLENALLRSSNPDELQDMINRGVAAPTQTRGNAPARR